MGEYAESDAEAACILNRAAEAGVFDDLIQDRRDNPSAYVLIHDRVVELIGRSSGVDWKVPHWEPCKPPRFDSQGEVLGAAALGTLIHENFAEELARRREKKILFTVGGHGG